MRRVALIVCVLTLTAAPLAAQSHERPHGKTYPHGPGHVRPDSATHAALHALFHGEWTGTMASHHGKAGETSMSLRYDSLLTIKTGTHASVAAQLAYHGGKIRWVQAVNGASCNGTAEKAGETLKGTLACADGERSFVLRRKAD